MGLEILAGCPKKDLKKIWWALSERLVRRGYKKLPNVIIRWEYERYSEESLIGGPPLGFLAGVGNITCVENDPNFYIDLPFNIMKWMAPCSNVDILIHYASWVYVLTYHCKSTSKRYKLVSDVFSAMGGEKINGNIVLVKKETPIIYGQKK